MSCFSDPSPRQSSLQAQNREEVKLDPGSNILIQRPRFIPSRPQTDHNNRIRARRLFQSSILSLYTALILANHDFKGPLLERLRLASTSPRDVSLPVANLLEPRCRRTIMATWNRDATVLLQKGPMGLSCLRNNRRRLRLLAGGRLLPTKQVTTGPEGIIAGEAEESGAGCPRCW